MRQLYNELVSPIAVRATKGPGTASGAGGVWMAALWIVADEKGNQEGLWTARSEAAARRRLFRRSASVRSGGERHTRALWCPDGGGMRPGGDHAGQGGATPVEEGYAVLGGTGSLWI